MGQILVAAVNLDGQHIATLLVAVAAVITAIGTLTGKFKFRPGEKEQVEVDVAASTLNIAKGTVEMIASQFQEQFRRINAEANEEREVHRKEQAEMRALHAEQMAAERKSSAAIRKELAEANREVKDLRAALREAWNEAEKWKAKYHRDIGPATKPT